MARPQARPAILALACWLAMAGCSEQGVKDTQPTAAAQVDIELSYATDRAASGDNRPDHFFGSDRGPLSFGTLNVVLDAAKNRGRATRDSDWQPPPGSPSGEKISTGLQQVHPLDAAQFQHTLAQKLTDEDRSVLLYLHGYKRSFKRSAINLARLTYAMNYRGLPVLYSWPSQNSPAAYSVDSNTMRWSSRHFVEALDLIAATRGVSTIHIMAHSMGNQALLYAIDQQRRSNLSDRWQIGEVILVAPDVDRDRFERDALPVLEVSGVRTTLYISDIDVPLQTSMRVNNHPRLGDASAGVFVAPGLETVDASDVSALLTGHSYHLDTDHTVWDLHYLLEQGLAAAHRPTLEARSEGDLRYWVIRSQ